MSQQPSPPLAKIVDAGHTTTVKGLKKFLNMVQEWPEIKKIYIGEFSNASGRGRGGFHFTATRWSQFGSIVDGVKCTAHSGRCAQNVYLCGPDPGAIKARLVKAGHCGNW